MVWNTFMDFNRWAPRREFSRGLVWLAGGAWEPGSSFELDVQFPSVLRLSGKLSAIDPPHRLAWISHGNGVTNVHTLEFGSEDSRHATLRGFGYFTGEPFVPCTPSRDETHFKAYASFYELFKDECESRAAALAGR